MESQQVLETIGDRIVKAARLAASIHFFSAVTDTCRAEFTRNSSIDSARPTMRTSTPRTMLIDD